MVLYLLAHTILLHRQCHVRGPLKDGQMGYLLCSFSMLAIGRDSDVAYLRSDLLNHLDATRAGTNDPDSLSGHLDALLRPSACVTAWSFKGLTSFDVGYVGFGCEALGEPVIDHVGRTVIDTLTVQRIKWRAEALY